VQGRVRRARLKSICAICVLCSAGCVGRGPAPDASYDPFTSRLIQLTADLDGDGRPDERTYMDGNRVLRAEADTDGDGRVDRWEYYAQSELQRVGTSSRSDGVEDTWTWAPGADGLRRVDISRGRDRAIDRREFFRGDELVRAEEDTNLDGRLDKWEQYESGVLRQVELDTTKARGRPDRRLLYDAQGRFQSIAADDDGDGVFELMTIPEPGPRPRE
jgi:hypothetical protein